MSSNLRVLETTSHVEPKLTFWEKLFNRICPPYPPTPEELLNWEAYRLTQQATQKAMEADANLFTAATIKASEEAAFFKAQRKEIEIRLNLEKEAREAEQKVDDQLRIKFTARQPFQHAGKDGYQIIATIGSSNSDKRGVIQWRSLDPNGSIIPVTNEMQEFFRARMLYTNAVLPWIHGEITSDELKASEYNRDTGARVEFPLSGIKKKK